VRSARCSHLLEVSRPPTQAMLFSSSSALRGSCLFIACPRSRVRNARGTLTCGLQVTAMVPECSVLGCTWSPQLVRSTLQLGDRPADFHAIAAHYPDADLVPQHSRDSRSLSSRRDTVPLSHGRLFENALPRASRPSAQRRPLRARARHHALGMSLRFSKPISRPERPTTKPTRIGRATEMKGRSASAA
jgi:hypothetical protein